MSEAVQKERFSEAELTGRQAHEFVGCLATLVDEARLTLGPSGIESTVVDPACVAFLNLSVHSDHLEYANGVDETVGISVNRLRAAIRPARKGRGENGGDPAVFKVDDQTFESTVHRDEDMEYRSKGAYLDPDQIRSPDGLTNVEKPPWQARLSLESFKTAINTLSDNGHEYLTFEVRLREKGLTEGVGSLYIHATGDGTADGFSFDGVADFKTERAKTEAQDTVTVLSVGYAKKIVKALGGTSIENVTLSLGDTFPVFVEGKSESTGLSAGWGVAPRIIDDDEEVSYPSWDDAFESDEA